MRTQTILSLLFLAASTVMPGCTCVARNAETYRIDTRNVLETRSGAIKDCYDVALATDPGLAGTVVVKFKVEKKTGKLVDTSVDTGRGTAPESLGKCIVEAVDGLTLDPVDQRNGIATFSWIFKAGAPLLVEQPAS